MPFHLSTSLCPPPPLGHLFCSSMCTTLPRSPPSPSLFPSYPTLFPTSLSLMFYLCPSLNIPSVAIHLDLAFPSTFPLPPCLPSSFISPSTSTPHSSVPFSSYLTSILLFFCFTSSFYSFYHQLCLPLPSSLPVFLLLSPPLVSSSPVFFPPLFNLFSFSAYRSLSQFCFHPSYLFSVSSLQTPVSPRLHPSPLPPPHSNCVQEAARYCEV